MNERMINHIAGRFVRSGIPFEELKAEAIKAYYIAESRYDKKHPSGASLETVAWRYIYQSLIVYTSAEMEWQARKGDDDIEKYCPEQQDIPMFEMVSSLSKEAKEVCSVIFNAPGEYAALMPKMARGALVKKCREKGWSWPIIWRTFNEIKSALGGA